MASKQYIIGADSSAFLLGLDSQTYLWNAVLIGFKDSSDKYTPHLNQLKQSTIDKIVEKLKKEFNFATSKSSSSNTDHFDTFKTSSQNSSIFLNKMIRKIGELYMQEAQDDYTPPTNYAFDFATELLIETSCQLPKNVTPGIVSVTDTGGLRFQWFEKEKQIRISIPHTEEERGYIYYQNSDKYGIDWDIRNLSSRLSWCLDLVC